MSNASDTLSSNATMMPSNATESLPIRVALYSCDKGQMVQRFVTDVIVSLPIASIGIIGNLIAFVVLCRQKQKLTTSVLLQGLAILDTLILLSTILLSSLRTMHICVGGLDLYYSIFHFVFRWLYPCMYFFRQAQTWLVTLLTIDRWIAVCRPLHAQRLCTLSTAYKQMAAVLALAFLINIPRFFEIELTTGANKFGFVFSELSRNKIYTIVYKIVVFFVLMYLLPMVTLVVLNTQLLCTLRRATKYRAQMQSRALTRRGMTDSSNPSDSPTNRSHRSITVIVCVVVLVCIISNLFAITAHLLWSLGECFEHLSSLEKYRRHVARINNVLVTVTSAINFFIYCLCSRNFRTVLIRTFRCRRQLNGRRHKSNMRANTFTFTSNTSHTSLSYMPIGQRIKLGSVDKSGTVTSCKL